MKNYLSACFVGHEDILYGLDTYSKVMYFQHLPNLKLGMTYITSLPNGVNLKLILKPLMVEKLQPSKYNKKEFFAVIKKFLVRGSIDNLLESPSRKGVVKEITRPDYTSFDIIEF